MVVRAGRGMIVAVADGVGGTGAGRYASWQVVDGLALFFTVARADFNPGMTVQQILTRTHASLQSLAASDRAYTMAQSTLAMLYIGPSGRRGYMLSIGDSPVFLHHNGAWAQLNTEHRDARGKVISAIGKSAPLRFSMRKMRFETGDRYLLCTDGVRDPLTNDELFALIDTDLHPARASERVVAAAERANSRDNMTALVVRFGDCPPAQEP